MGDVSAPTSCPTAFRLLQGAVQDMESESIQPSTMVSGYFNNGKWILQASQFERQARQLGVPQPRVTASAAAAVCGVSMAMD